MSDVQLLFIVLALLYAWECLCWLRPGSVALTTWIGRTWRVQHPGTLVGNDKGGFIIAAPLPPLGTVLVANQIPISVSPEGLLACVSTNVNPGPRPAQSWRLLRFDEIRETRAVAKKILLNGSFFLKVGSPSMAKHIARQVERLRKLASKQRDDTIGSVFRESLDSKAVERRWTEFLAAARPLRLLSNALIGFVFVLAPVAIWNLGFRLTWAGLLAGLLALTTGTALLFRRAHQKLFPSAEDERFTHTLTILLSPATAMRARDTLSRPLLESFHPLAVAKVFLQKEQFLQFARRILLDIRQPALPICPDDASVRKTEQFSRAALQQAVEDFLKQQGVDPDELCRAPAPTDESCRTYCPRCNTQFTSAASQCMDCGGLPVKTFAQP